MENMDATIANIQVFETKNCDQFKKLNGNRSLNESQVDGIINSIDEVGYQPVPILVNEKMEVIDGQHRLEAAKRLGIPIYFIIKPGAGAREVMQLNLRRGNWTVYDFIGFYSANGNGNYIKLNRYAKEHPDIGIIDIAMCLSDSKSRNIQRPLREGKYQIVETEEAIGCLRFIDDCIHPLSTIQGGEQQYIPILVGLYKMNLIDEDRMRTAINQYAATMASAYNANDALTELQNVYNYYRRHNEYFRDAYLEKMEKAGSRYKNI